MADPLPLSGSFQGPPADAPRETTQALDNAAQRAILAAAQARNQDLRGQAEATLPPFAPAVTTRSTEVPPPVVRHQPAASQTDSPSRGIPRASADPGKQITGGFGDLAAAQYFALDGRELKELVRLLLDEVNRQLENDLRFSLAITYPRVRAVVTVQVEGWAEDAGFEIRKQTAHEQTPPEVAETHGAEPTMFEVRAERREFDAEGHPENPPNRLRDELGLPSPRKQIVQAGAARMLVDVIPGMDGSF